jgi:hypothetical protein
MAQENHCVPVAEMMQGQGAEDEVPSPFLTFAPESDISLVKVDFRESDTAFLRHGKCSGIEINRINHDGKPTRTTPSDDLSGEISFAGRQIEDVEWS